MKEINEQTVKSLYDQLVKESVIPTGEKPTASKMHDYCDFNEVVCTYLGYDSNEGLDTPMFDAISDQIGKFMDLWNKVLTPQTYTYNVRINTDTYDWKELRDIYADAIRNASLHRDGEDTGEFYGSVYRNGRELNYHCIWSIDYNG